MASIKETVTYDYNANTSNYEKNLNDVNKETEELDKNSDSLGDSLDKLNLKFVAMGAAIGGAIVAVDATTDAILQNSFAQAQIQTNMDLTKQQADELTDSLINQGVQYGFNATEIKRISALNSAYVNSNEELATANELVIQTSILLAAKEGDVANAAEQAVTAQEALRDVVLTGSTTAFEDAGLQLDLYEKSLLKATGTTEAESQALKDSTNGYFEYVEALSKSADPQERFTALAEATNEQLKGTTENLDGAGQAMVRYKVFIEKAKLALFDVLMILIELTATTIKHTITIINAIRSTELWSQIMSYWITVAEMVFNIIIAIIPIVIKLTIAFFQFASFAAKILIPIMIRSFEVFIQVAKIVFLLAKIVAEKLIPIISFLISFFIKLLEIVIPVIVALGLLAITIFRFLQPVINILISILSILINIFITLLLPILLLVANVISTVLVVAIDILNIAISFLTPIIQFLAELFRILANVVNIILTPILNALKVIIEGLNVVFKIISDLSNKLTAAFDKLSNAIKNSLVKAFDLLTAPVEYIIGLFDSLLNIILSITDAILGGLIGAFNSIPFVPNIDTGSSRASTNASVGGSGISSAGARNVVRNNNITYNVTTQESMTLSRALRDRRLSIHHERRMV